MPGDSLTWGPDAADSNNAPSDVITGYPDHYIINGDTSSCGCVEHRNGHAPECEVWQTPAWIHRTILCNARRLLCGHTPRHTYGQACDDYHELFGAV